MANIKSQRKRNRQNERRRLHNRAVRSDLKTRVRSAREALETDSPDADERLRTAQQQLAKAGRKGVIHKNQARRRIARLMRRAEPSAGG